MRKRRTRDRVAKYRRDHEFPEHIHSKILQDTLRYSSLYLFSSSKISLALQAAVGGAKFRYGSIQARFACVETSFSNLSPFVPSCDLISRFDFVTLLNVSETRTLCAISWRSPAHFSIVQIFPFPKSDIYIYIYTARFNLAVSLFF